jgi:hypothetical protein
MPHFIAAPGFGLAIVWKTRPINRRGAADLPK